MKVVRTVPVEPVFTQGLAFLDDGMLLQSFGLYGQSGVRVIDPATGAVLRSMSNAPTEFGEGIDVRPDGNLLQLTWREKVVNVLDPGTLVVTTTLPLETEGWGVCVDDAGTAWTSDGSSRLTARDPDTMAVRHAVEVMDGNQAISQLNELECTPGGIWANIWHSDRLILISPTTGGVMHQLDLSELSGQAPRSPGASPSEAVLNGIAHDPRTGNLWVTGKDWTEIYEISEVDASSGTD